MSPLFGIARRRQEARPPSDASGLAELAVTDLDGKDVVLGSLWAERPAVLVWLRHYG